MAPSYFECWCSSSYCRIFVAPIPVCVIPLNLRSRRKRHDVSSCELLPPPRRSVDPYHARSFGQICLWHRRAACIIPIFVFWVILAMFCIDWIPSMRPWLELRLSPLQLRFWLIRCYTLGWGIVWDIYHALFGGFFSKFLFMMQLFMFLDYFLIVYDEKMFSQPYLFLALI